MSEPTWLQTETDDEVTLRDYFAAHALAGLSTSGIPAPYRARSVAVTAYEIADAMLEQRKVEGDGDG